MDKKLIDEGNNMLIEAWNEHVDDLRENIDKVAERGKVDKGVLLVMKELLSDGVVRPRKKTIEEYFEEQDKLNK